jgi:hypothetical protein
MSSPGTNAIGGFVTTFTTDQQQTVKMTIEGTLGDGSVHNEWGSSLYVYEGGQSVAAASRDDYFSVNATFDAEPGHTYLVYGGFSQQKIDDALHLGDDYTCTPPAQFKVQIDCQ